MSEKPKAYVTVPRGTKLENQLLCIPVREAQTFLYEVEFLENLYLRKKDDRLRAEWVLARVERYLGLLPELPEEVECE